jgi:hypothetical protein
MNKQEPKNKLWAITRLETARKVGKPFESKEYENGYEEGLKLAQRVIDTIDEPQKLVIPPELAEYIQDNEGESIGDVFSYEWLTHYDNQQLGDKVAKWLFDNDREENNRRCLIAVQAFITGDYEVEKELLYHVKLIIPGATYFIQTFLMPGDTHMCFSAATERYGAKWKNTFTEAEIKAIDERYWPFAVPVEEETEE